MKALKMRYLTLAVASVGILAGVKVASADEGCVLKSAVAATSAVGELPANSDSSPDAPSHRLPKVVDLAGVASRRDDASAPGAVVLGGASSVAHAAPQVDLNASDDPGLDGMCENECGFAQEFNLLPELIFEKFEKMPVLGLFVMPMTKGLTVEPSEGLLSVTFAVRPTRIARGSALVAIARF